MLSTICHDTLAGKVAVTGCVGGDVASGAFTISCGVSVDSKMGATICWTKGDGFSLKDEIVELGEITVYGRVMFLKQGIYTIAKEIK